MNREFCPDSCYGKKPAIDECCVGCRRENAKPANFRFQTKDKKWHQGDHQIDEFIYAVDGIGHHVLSIIAKEKC
jgi:hypothetical protein